MQVEGTPQTIMARLAHRSVVPILSIVIVVSWSAVAPPASAVGCAVKNGRTGASYDTLQRAVDASAKDDTLRIHGTCYGRTVIAGTSLHLKGIATAAQPRPTLDGNDAGRVMRVHDAEVTLTDLTVTNGRVFSMRGGAGIVNTGTLTLDGSTAVRGNRSWYGGGITNEGTLFMKGSASVRGNHASGGDGGVINTGTMVMANRAKIRHNSNHEEVAGGISNSGTLILRGHSSIASNKGGWYGGVGNSGKLVLRDFSSVRNNSGWTTGGIHNEGVLVLRGSSTVEGNSSLNTGGGIDTIRPIMIEGDASVRSNSAGTDGGGVYLHGRGRVKLSGSGSITKNTTDGEGGGVYALRETQIILKGTASITHNTARVGGGIRLTQKAVVYLCSEGATISPNHPDDPPKVSSCT